MADISKLTTEQLAELALLEHGYLAEIAKLAEGQSHTSDQLTAKSQPINETPPAGQISNPEFTSTHGKSLEPEQNDKAPVQTSPDQNEGT